MKQHPIYSIGVILAVLSAVGAMNASSFSFARQPSNAAVLMGKQMSTRQILNRSMITNAAIQNQAEMMQLSAGHTRFGMKLFSQIYEPEENENIFISPLSVAIALQMLHSGAAGETEQAIATALEIQGMSREEIQRGIAALQTHLENLDPGVEVAIANALWGRQEESFQSDFIQKIKEFYSAEVANINFDNIEEALQLINGWVKQNTQSKINQILEPGEIDESTIAVLVNAIYFKANWTVGFSKSKTQDIPFTLPDGTTKLHPLMFHSEEYLYYQNKTFQAVGLPYGKEAKVNLYIFLPNPEVSLQEFCATLTPQNWEMWLNQFDYNQVSIGLPRFKVEYDITLNDPLQAIGMNVLFSGKADFTEMIPGSFSISKVKHKTFVEVNEEGTEAAAVTAVLGTRGGGMNNPIEMNVNRPFFFAIRDEATGTLLFMGTIVEPEV